MTIPNLRGYELENQIYSAMSRVIVLWFSKIERDAEEWKQIQITLIGARLETANLEIIQGFPPLKSCETSEKQTQQGKRIQFAIYFDKGVMSFECENIACSEYSRKIRVLRSS